MKRPEITQELLLAAAVAFCKQEGWDNGEAADIARVYRGTYMDGYELAKRLEDWCGWQPDAQTVDVLDNFSSAVTAAHRKECIAWAHDNNIQPPLPIGTMTTRGEITGLSDYDGATYLVKPPIDGENRRLLVRFEDARQAT